MCKIMIVPSVTPDKSEALLTFATAAAKFLTAGDPHGFGYAAVAKKKLSGECWLNPKDAFTPPPLNNTAADQSLIDALGTAVIPPAKTYRSFGHIKRNKITSILLHARYATCDIGISNTHPFVSGNTAMIHNGVVDTEGLRYATSTCDSEGILNAYIDDGVAALPDNIQSVADKLDGWYAVAVLTKIESRWYVDVFRDHRANLICSFVNELNSIVYCTTEDILRKTVKACNFSMGSVFTVKAGLLLRFDALTGECVLQQAFDPKPKRSALLTFPQHYRDQLDAEASALRDENRRLLEEEGFTEDQVQDLVEQFERKYR